MSLTPTAAYTWVSGETVTATKLNTAGVPVIPDGQDYAFSLGTALLPSMAFNGDTNTGVYSPGADQWAVATAGVQRFSVTTTGLGITLPLTSTVTTGTAPFVVASTTNVANLNASSLNGATFAAPGPIGTTPSTGAFTTLSATGQFTSTATGEIFRAVAASAGDKFGTISNTNGSLEFGVNAAGNSFLTASSGDQLLLTIAGTPYAAISSTGVAVTGTLSATGTISSTSTSRNALSGALLVSGANPSSATAATIVDNSSGDARIICYGLNSATRGTFTMLGISSDGSLNSTYFTANSTGLAVTGTLTTSSTTLHTSSVSLTNGAAAAAGTLTNAPVAGNPTKWIPIVDNGTTRYIPCW